jgi:molecular chaperone GrpE
VTETNKTAEEKNETDDQQTTADTPVEGVKGDAEPVADEVQEASGSSEQAEDSTADDPRVAELEQQLKDLQNQYLRLQADFENFKRRTRAEREDLIQFATSRLIQSLLPVLDNLELALVAGKDAQDAASVAKGVEMVVRQFQTILEQEGLTAMQTVGQPFDPNQHEGVMQVEASEEFPPGTVVEELRKGYVLKGKVIRPAMVKVSQ